MNERKIIKIDASGKALGRLASEIAIILRGKNKPEFVPHQDVGDIVELYNVDKIKYTGKKLEQKEYYRYSGYPGGLKTEKMKDKLAKNPKDVIVMAVRKMLPATRLRNGMLKRIIVK